MNELFNYQLFEKMKNRFWLHVLLNVPIDEPLKQEEAYPINEREFYVLMLETTWEINE